MLHRYQRQDPSDAFDRDECRRKERPHSLIVYLSPLYVIVELLIIGKFFIMEEYAVAPLIAQIAIFLVDFLPAVPVNDLIVAQESLKCKPVLRVNLKGIFKHLPFKLFLIGLALLPLLESLLLQSLLVLLLQSLLD